MIQAEFDSDVVTRLRRVRVVPVITIDDAENAVPLARALVAGGLSCAEITFRTAAAAAALQRISAEVPEVLVGAGTVLTASQADAALEAGAQFIVAPGFAPHVVEYCQAHAVAVFPGVATPTEIEAALETGLRTLKFFPAEPLGGLTYLKAVAAPYADVSFIPTGGINATNVASYLAFDRVVACGGSWMAPAAWIAAKQFDRIRDESRRAVDAAHGRTPPVVV
ncbi:MAG TPA: bifunctional 4-hydroxy-2-oxoglutarate aldolase/2-dehydro-3-deoxy-phosphogluconate aldolase [Gemmatimonadaceae bacterium]|nr:bifunctional 4-hydroxy-2-oxoglutarate aldolase/2-dehydro-3-deoxy-phosphogluconate aldolase [Gemmatimonadaceae bacterium]